VANVLEQVDVFQEEVKKVVCLLLLDLTQLAQC